MEWARQEERQRQRKRERDRKREIAERKAKSERVENYIMAPKAFCDALTKALPTKV